ncbi:MAG: cytochrome c [Anaerolineales bacterium]|nr:cytochrome c [Anaerolineales bacterium]
MMARFAVLLILAGVLLAACGTHVTELRPTFEPTATFDFSMRVAADQPTVVSEERPTLEPTITPPTATPEPTTVVAEEPTPEPTEETPALDLPGDPAIGQILFNNIPAPSTGQRCMTCHNPNQPIPGTGPYLYGIATVAGERRAGYTAEEYLRESIINPNAFMAPAQGEAAWTVDLMPKDWRQAFTDEDLDNIVSYLLTLTQQRPQ